MSTHVDEDAAPRTAVLILLLVWLSGCRVGQLPDGQCRPLTPGYPKTPPLSRPLSRSLICATWCVCVRTSSFRLQFPAEGVGLLTATPSPLTTQIDQVGGPRSCLAILATTLPAVCADRSESRKKHTKH